MSNTRKIWGIKYRLLETEKTEIDLLYLEAKTACSVHSHSNKINRFCLLSGSVIINSDLGVKELVINEPFDCEPPSVHQFIVNEPSVMIEMAFVKEGRIDPKDIKRIKQGGRDVDGKFYTLDELREKNWLPINYA